LRASNPRITQKFTTEKAKSTMAKERQQEVTWLWKDGKMIGSYSSIFAAFTEGAGLTVEKAEQAAGRRGLLTAKPHLQIYGYQVSFTKDAPPAPIKRGGAPSSRRVKSQPKATTQPEKQAVVGMADVIARIEADIKTIETDIATWKALLAQKRSALTELQQYAGK
jgi:hypothetical protein